jgi:hypothetical protein
MKFSLHSGERLLTNEFIEVSRWIAIIGFIYSALFFIEGVTTAAKAYGGGNCSFLLDQYKHRIEM